MNALVLYKNSPRKDVRRVGFWKYVQILFVTAFLFVVCVTLEKSTQEELSVEAKVIEDVRRVETEIAHLFGYEKWPLAPTKVAYSTNCDDGDSYSYRGTITLGCDVLSLRQGKPFQKKNAFGEEEVFPGYVEYLSLIIHETAHNFSSLFIDVNAEPWVECNIEEYRELSEGFATYAEYQLLLRETSDRRQYERYIAARTARYAIQLSKPEQRISQSSLSDFLAMIALSTESRRDWSYPHFRKSKNPSFCSPGF